MIPRCLLWVAAITTALHLGACLAHAQTLTIDGVTDRSTYTDSVTLRVQTNAGFTYLVTLNGKLIAPGVFHTNSVMDYYDLFVQRVEAVTGTTTNRLVRFIVLSSQRGSPERGLIQWVPLPPIPSTAAEMAGARLHLMMPETYPAGLEIPVTVRVEDAAGLERRVNGWVNSTGIVASSFRMLRGVGHGFLPGTAPGTFSYAAQLQSLQTNKQIHIEPSTTWTTVSGTLGETTWPPHSRLHVTGDLTIPAGVTLTVGEGSVVRLNPGVNITNSGTAIINGTTTQPIVFTATNRVAPEQRTGAWGGWIMRGGQLVATAAIMTGSGAAASMSYSPGSSHRSEQPLLFAHNSVVRMTNCALITLAGQVGNGYDSSIIWDHCLIQRAITCGEYDGGTNIIVHSALIEFPAVDGVYSAAIADADYDGFYTINTTNYFEHSLFGFCKDDAIDSGSGGAGTVVLRNCWVESALHEALAWSGEGRQTWTYNSVLMNCGQGIECGWSTGANSPLCYASNLLSTANSVGARFGDNYTTADGGLGTKNGFLTVTNSFILNNYRDVWGQVWDDTWNYRVARMDIQNNYLGVPNTNHPNNTVWNPPAHAALLAPLMQTPPEAAVGIGFANWEALTLPALTNGVPIRLSTFTTNVVSMNFVVQTPSTTLASGTLLFQPGETVKRITAPIAGLGAQDLVRVSLSNPINGEFTAGDQLLIVPADPSANTNVAMLAFNSAWKYLDNGSDQGSAWRAPGFNDAGWSNGLAQLGFGDNPVDETTFLRRTNSGGTTNVTFYFRKQVAAPDLATLSGVRMRLLRDDAGVVYINGSEVFRSPNLPASPAAITYLTRASSTGENSIDSTTLGTASFNAGTNLVAVEIHQESITSSDVSFDLELMGNLAAGRPRLNLQRFDPDLVLYWSAPSYLLEASTDPAPSGGWAPVANAISPVTVTPSGSERFYRLRK